MKPFFDICRRVRFSLDAPGQETAGDEETRVAEYAAQMRSSALRVTETLTPEIHRAVAKVSEQLSLEVAPECFIVADPIINASAPLFGSQHRPLIVLSSAIVELLSIAELEFVLGHELGHLGCGHGTESMRNPPGSEYETLHRLSESRAKEISADRIGLLAVRSLFTAAGVMVKLASGLNSEHVRLNVAAFLDQLRRDPAEVSREWELHHTHPSLPFRLLALIKFSDSGEYLQMAGTGGSGRPLKEVDAEIIADLDQLGDGQLSKLQQERFDRTVGWAGAALFMNEGRDGVKECDALERLIGGELSNKVLEFARQNDSAELEMRLRQSLEMLSSTGPQPVDRFLDTYRSLAKSLGLKPERTGPWHTISRSLDGG